MAESFIEPHDEGFDAFDGADDGAYEEGEDILDGLEADDYDNDTDDEDDREALDAEYRRNEAAAISRCAVKAHLQGGISFEGPAMERPDMHDYPSLWIKNNITEKQRVIFAGESRPNRHERAIIRFADQGIDDLGGLINVTVPPPVGPVRVFANQADYETAYKRAADADPQDSVGVFTAASGLIWRRQTASDRESGREEAEMLHERIHMRSHITVTPELLTNNERGPTYNVQK